MSDNIGDNQKRKSPEFNSGMHASVSSPRKTHDITWNSAIKILDKNGISPEDVLLKFNLLDSQSTAQPKSQQQTSDKNENENVGNQTSEPKSIVETENDNDFELLDNANNFNINSNPNSHVDDPKEYNILLLGQTGAGKSTTINAITNYLKYASFEEAKAGDFVQLIPTQFLHFDAKTAESVVIQSGSDVNENHHQEGESCTQSPVGYLFKDGKNNIRIIDTPGIGDTRGIEVDRENFDQIIKFINHFKNLHGICILVNSNETRMTFSFRYCMTELLANLHQSACKNIFFCFTFARSTNFAGGGGYLILKSFLQNELRESELCLTPKKNCFFIDNEAYRYLVAKKSGIVFDKEEEEKCHESWTMSSSNTKMMIDSIMKMTPHNVEQTKLLNYTQKLIMALAEPLVLMQRNLQINIPEIELRIEALKMHPSSNEETKPQMNIEDLKWNKLEPSKTTCTESRCVKFSDYNSPCHIDCNEIDPPNGIIGSTQLKKCSQMSQSGSCTKCGCHWSKHMHVSAQFTLFKNLIIEQQVYNNSQNASVSTEKFIEELEKRVKQYKFELAVLETILAKLCFLVERHSNTSPKKFIEPMLDKLIDEELKRLKYSDTQTEAVKNILVQIKDCHIKRVQDRISAKNTSDVKFEYVSTYCKQLAEIKPLDKVLKNFNDYQEKESREFKQCDVVFEF